MIIPFNRFKPQANSKPTWHRTIILILLAATLVSIVIAIKLYFILFGASLRISNNTNAHLYVRKGASAESVTNDLLSRGCLLHPSEFKWFAKKRALNETLKPGHYLLIDGMSNYNLVRMLTTGHQTPINLIFHNIRTMEQLASRVASQLETDSTSLMNAFSDTSMLKKLNMSAPTLPTLFIPNTYELYWTISAEDFMKRMHREYEKFWDSTRLDQCKKTGLSINEVVTLASIVEEETNKNSEKSRIAGVYVNRLHNRMPLQADPTVKFAIGDFSIRRILKGHLKTDSPYNTYLNAGLPPGPICLPSIASVDAVLNYEQHGFLYFCAKDDLSGYHEFARDYTQHLNNARRYQRTLNAHGIK